MRNPHQLIKFLTILGLIFCFLGVFQVFKNTESPLINFYQLNKKSISGVIKQSIKKPKRITWIKKENVAQYKGGSWNNFIKRVSNTTVNDAKKIAESDSNITFFFFMKGYSMYLETKSVRSKTHPIFKKNDAVFFSGEPWLGSAPGFADTYIKSESK